MLSSYVQIYVAFFFLYLNSPSCLVLLFYEYA